MIVVWEVYIQTFKKLNLSPCHLTKVPYQLEEIQSEKKMPVARVFYSSVEDELADGCYKCRGYYTAEEMDVWVKTRKGDKCLCGDCNVMVIRLSR